MTFDRGKRRLFFFLASLGVFVILINVSLLSGGDATIVDQIPISGQSKPLSDPPTSPDTNLPDLPSWDDDLNYENSQEPSDNHPIATLMKAADAACKVYEEDRSQTFRQVVSKYRRKYGRHPPPGFKQWYQFARKKNVHNIDDFEQIMDDIRPFWAIEPKVLRYLAAYMSENQSDGVAGIHIRSKRIVNVTNTGWRSDTLKTLIERFVDRLPDMDIAMNRLDQPRVVVPWDDMQAHLQKELETRQLPPDAIDSFTTKMDGLRNVTYGASGGHREDAAWFLAPGKQYMDIASLACPPDTPAQNKSMSIEDADKIYKSDLGGIVTNFNLSSDLCTVGPAIQDKHGFLFSSSSVIASKRLVPIFGECKVNVNSDILFPANMYWKHDDRYDYDPEHDLDWDDKKEVMVWRGVTSGGVQIKENWRRLHRQRLVMLTNGTLLGKDATVTILTQAPPPNTSSYINHHFFHPSAFATKYTDIGFTEAWGCVPGDCPFYKTPVQVWEYKPPVTLSEQFKNKYLVDVDGHSFSGRWRAFLESKSLGLKATIFREWHDSRLFAWRHFVPMDNRYDDLYSLLTYFIGVGDPPVSTSPLPPSEMALEVEHQPPYIASHDFEASRLGRQGREWAKKVLRRDDIEVYMYRLLLEYARVVDDNRDRIGYSGDGSELDKWDASNPVTKNHW